MGKSRLHKGLSSLSLLTVLFTAFYPCSIIIIIGGCSGGGSQASINGDSHTPTVTYPFGGLSRSLSEPPSITYAKCN